MDTEPISACMRAAARRIFDGKTTSISNGVLDGLASIQAAAHRRIRDRHWRRRLIVHFRTLEFASRLHRPVRRIFDKDVGTFGQSPKRSVMPDLGIGGKCVQQ